MQYIFFVAFLLFLSISDLPSMPKVKFGIDVLIDNNFEPIAGKNVLLLCNNASRTSNGKSTLDVFKEQNKFSLLGLLTPEHGYYTSVPAGKLVNKNIIEGVNAFSLYTSSKEPDKKLLSKADVIVIDIQDIGIRSYTFLSSVFRTMEVCALNSIPVIILDRPNPLGGLVIDGGTVEPELISYVGIAPVSYLHGCTIGELALMFNEENWLNNGKSKKCNLNIIRMKDWKRSMLWEDTGSFWFPTSPHIPTTDAIKGAAVLGSFGELGIISIGIGTTLPFQYLGKPDLNKDYLKKIADDLNGELKLTYSEYQPFYGLYANKNINGLLLKFTNSNAQLYSAGFNIFLDLRKKYPGLFNPDNIKPEAKRMFSKVTGKERLLDLLQLKGNDKEVLEEMQKGISKYKAIRSKYLLYD